MPTASIIIDTLECAKTTERGADEIYILVIAKRSDGRTHFARLPSDAPNQASGHWDMNDSSNESDNANGDSKRINGKTVFTGDLESGQTWEVLIMIMEEDGGTTKTAQQIGAALLANSGNPYAVAAGGLLSLLTFLGLYAVDSDDFPGSFGARISNAGGNISVAWEAKERVTETNAYRNGFEFVLRGDGSHYKCWTRWQ